MTVTKNCLPTNISGGGIPDLNTILVIHIKNPKSKEVETSCSQ